MRESGILMHITSLPGAYGVGTVGKEAYSFVDFLKAAGQHNWQVLPLNPTGYGNSPYQASSAYAGNPYLIDLDALVEDGLLERGEIERVDWGGNDRVDFGIQYANRLNILRLAFGRFQETAAFQSFCRENGSWLPDFALFMALKEKYGGQPWYQWEAGLKFRDPDAIWRARQELKQELRFHSFVQFLFSTQWEALRRYAHENGVKIIGDVPIYVPYDSADVWKDPELFQLDEALDPVAVAGCPPDAFSEDGQLWGNPLYRWERKEAVYAWWMQRLEAAGKWYDMVRVDHFRGFESYWSVPYGDTTAKNGKWIPGPGLDFFKAVKEKMPGLRLIAEDLGYLTPEVLQMRHDSGYPGMKVLGFAFDSREPSDYLPHTYTKNCVCYTGTHDNMTTRQWFDTAPEDAVAYAKAYMNLDEEEGYVWGMIRTAMSSVADLCIVPVQDYLDLGAEARMNFPGTNTDGNWTWRAENGFADGALAEKIRKLTELYCR